MASLAHKRAKSDPPPILVEDTGRGEDMKRTNPGLFEMAGSEAEHITGESRVQKPSANSPARPNPPQDPPRDSFTPRQRRNTIWERGHRRQRSPNVEWHEKWTKDSWQNGRVLLIDYVDKEHTSHGRRKIVAQEFNDIDGLRKYYGNEELSSQAALRVIHVQNASWATRFLLRKFNIDATDDLVGTSFGRWARYERPQRRANKPVLNGKTFRTQRDPWRGISRTSFGLDYLKHYAANSVHESEFVKSTKMMALNHYDEYDLPTHTYDVHVQRLSVYVQFSYDRPGADVDPSISNPYDDEEHQYHENLKKQYASAAHPHAAPLPKLRTLDNSNTIILFEHSQTGSVEDTLIGARQELELKWRRLTFYMPRAETDDDALLVPKCMDLILSDVFRALCTNWERYASLCEVHTGILEDLIYENPADETRAPELWTNASLWLKVERLMYLHIDLVRELRAHLYALDHCGPWPDDPLVPWLDSAAEELLKLTTLFQEGVLKPTEHLSDLLYKSVGIRDARHGIELGLSMWRLSWITFVFLPLTFVTGFFGMNVDAFEGNPSIRYFVAAAGALFALVIALWYAMKTTLASARDDAARRTAYEEMYAEWAGRWPELWTRRGPRGGVVPVGWWAGWKWRVVTGWFGSEMVVQGQGARVGGTRGAELGGWEAVKKGVARRWLGGLAVLPGRGLVSELDVFLREEKEKGAVGELVGSVVPVGPVGVGVGRGAGRKGWSFRRGERGRSEGEEEEEERRRDRSEEGRPGSGVMVEEKGVGSEDERSEDGGGNADTGMSEGTRGVRGSRERLHVPVMRRGEGT